MDLLNFALKNPKLLNAVGKQLGFSNGIPPQFMSLATTLIFGVLANKSKTEEGQNSIFKVLQGNMDKDNQGFLQNILTNIPNLIGGQSKNDGFLNSIFNDQENGVVDGFSKATGLKSDQAKKILSFAGMVLFAYFANRLQNKNTTKKDIIDEIQEAYAKPDKTTQTHEDGGLLEQFFGGGKSNDKQSGIGLDDLGGLLKNILLK